MNEAVQDRLAAEVIRVRQGQIMINEMIKKGAFKIPVHLGLGHEAIAVAVAATMTDADLLTLTHRNIHYNLARGKSAAPEIKEYLLHKDGLAGGTQGSMNLAYPDEGVIYTSSILGNNLAVGAGLAMSRKVKGTDGVTFIVTGDGAMEEGTFYESMLFQKTFGLSSIFVIENNEWSLGTRISERRCDIDIKKLVSGLDLHYEKFEGNNVNEYAERLRALRQDTLRDKKPIVIEVMLTTLGDWRMFNDQHPDGKFINYHHGAAPDVNASDTLVIRDTAEDPVHVLSGLLADGRMEELRREAKKLLEDGLDEIR